MEFFGLEILEIIGRLLLGVGIGFCIGLSGVGGGVLGLQAMTMVIGLDPVRAVGTTSLYIFLTNISASIHHARAKTVRWGVAGRILIGAIPANLLLSSWISRQGASPAFQQGLRNFIVGVVLFSVGVMTLNLIRRSRAVHSAEKKTLAERIDGDMAMRNLMGVLAGAIVGGLIGATSVGGGVLIVPLLLVVFGLSAGRTVGTSITIAMVLTLLTSLIYGRGGELDAVTAVVMAVGSLAGVPFGVKLSVRMPEKILQVVVIVIILVAAIMMLLNGGT